jgi:hypothetical protein
MQKQQHRVVTILSANADPLLDPANSRERLFVDASHWIDASGSTDIVLSVHAIPNASRDGECDEYCRS